MAPREFRHALADMLEAIDGIQAAIDGKTVSDDEREWLLRHGIERRIEIISEASRALPEEMTANRPDVPWRSIRGIGNVLRHEYHGVSNLLMWGVVVDELPILRDAVETIVAGLAERQPEAGERPQPRADR